MTNVLDPVRLSPGWSYNLNSLKQIKITKHFQNIPDDEKLCSIEPIDNCTTRKYVENLRENCGCLPLRMQTEDDEDRVCLPDKFGCINNISVVEEDCYHSCSGIHVTAFEKTKLLIEDLHVFQQLKAEYRNYSQIKLTNDFPDLIKGYSR